MIEVNSILCILANYDNFSRDPVTHTLTGEQKRATCTASVEYHVSG